MVTVEEQKDEKIFDLTTELLKHIPKLAEPERQIAIRYFEFKVLEHSGFKPQYGSCITCGKKLEPAEFFAGSFEGVLCPECKGGKEKISLNTLKILKIFTDKSLATVLNISDIGNYNENLKQVILPQL
jgi:DNA repair protein RecO